MGHARGVICLAAAEAGIPVVHYASTQVKRILTGAGRADKSQMQRAIQREFAPCLQLPGAARRGRRAGRGGVPLFYLKDKIKTIRDEKDESNAKPLQNPGSIP